MLRKYHVALAAGLIAAALPLRAEAQATVPPKPKPTAVPKGAKTPAKPALKPAAKPVAAAASEEFSDSEAEDFAYPVAWLKTAPAKQRLQYMNAVRQILKAGWEMSPRRRWPNAGSSSTRPTRCAPTTRG